MRQVKRAYPDFKGIYEHIFVCPKCGGDTVPTNHHVPEVGKLWYCFECESYYDSGLRPQPKPEL
jgi:hypothetical protein